MIYQDRTFWTLSVKHLFRSLRGAKKNKNRYENIKYNWIHTTDTAESSVSRIMTEFLGM